MDENTRRLAQFLLSEKDTRPHWETDQRAMLMPLVMSGYNNSVAYGVPSFLGGHAWSTMGDIVKGNAVHPDEIAHSANDAAGAAMLGSMPMGATRRGASLGSGGGNTKAPAASALPMDQASRMARAREMGFDVDRPWYHGSANALESGQFEAGHVGASASVKRPWLSEAGHYFADDINHAGIYGDVGEFLLRGKVKDIDLSKIDGGFAKWSKELGYKDPQKAIDSYYAGDIYNALNVDSELLNQSKIAKSEGYDVLRASLGGLTGNGIKGSIAVVFDPKHIRSIDAAFDPAKADSHYLLAANPKTSAAAPLALEAMKDKGGSGIRAYHGSPHDFDRFDMSKIGTGEGAQAFGHGLYFAENEGVARAYRDQLAKGFTGTDGAPLPRAMQQALEFVHPKFKETGDMRAGLEDAIRRMADQSEFYRKTYGDGWNIYDGALEKLRAVDPATIKPAGRMYEVNINARPEQFLDWDAPLSAQSREVIDAVSGLPYGRAALNAQAPTGSMRLLEDFASNQGLREGADTRGYGYGARRAADDLRQAGIPGIRYLDQGSRGAGEGSRNYVVFDDKLVEILRKYGLAGILAGGYAMTGQEPQE